MKIKSFTFNPFQENTYIIYDETRDCIIIDPGCYTEEEQETLKKFIITEKLNPVQLINTHCHIDHIAGSNEAMDKLQIKLEISPLSVPLLGNVGPIAASFGYNISKIEHGTFLNEGDKVTIGKTTFDILHCPGHSPDSLCFYTKGILIGGDLIFKGSVGRTDLPGGNPLELMESIKEKILPLPENTIIYPGHGTKTTLKEEKENNPFITGKVNII